MVKRVQRYNYFLIYANKWGFFKKNRPLYARIGIFREGEHRRQTKKKRREEKREGAPQVNRLDPAKRYTRIGRVPGGGGEYSPDGTREEKPKRNEGTSG